MKTGCWFIQYPADHIMVGISRMVPRKIPAGYRLCRKLAPGPWFNSVSVREYDSRYWAEVLAPLDPRVVAKEIIALSRGRTPVLVCYERAGGPGWCHRALVAEWLADALGCPVPEFGFEHLPQHEHPLMHPSLRRA